MSLMTQQQSKIVPYENMDDVLKVIRSMYASTLTDAQLEVFNHVCKRTGLDPSRNQIYAITRKTKQNDGSYTKQMTIQTGIDGFRLIAERTGKYSPGREPFYAYDAQGKLVSATSFIKKQTHDGTWHEVSATAFWSEYVQTSKDYKTGDMIVNKFWQQMPHGQLAKCAESLALRKAFPADYSGLYSTEEMGQANNNIQSESDIQVQASTVQELPKEEPKAIEQEDIKKEELLLYLDKKWGGNQEKFHIYMEEIMKSKGWDYRKSIEMFEKHPDYTKKSFDAWLAEKVGL